MPEPENIMVITTGTSLLYSASWDPDSERLAALFQPEIAGLAEDYRKDYCDKHINEPGERQISRNNVHRFLKAAITADSVDAWRACYQRSFGNETNMRYSAELATLYDFLENEIGGKWENKLNNFLVNVVFDPCDPQSNAIGNHLMAYLQVEFPNAAIKPKEIDYFSSTEQSDLIRGLQEFWEFLTEECIAISETFLNISGGYKIYSMMAANFIQWESSAKMLYLNENSSSVIIQDINSIRSTEFEFPFPAE